MTIFRCSAVLHSAILLALSAPLAGAQDIAVPSGQAITQSEVIWETEDDTAEVWVRFRFVAPQIAGDAGISFDQAAPDLLALCETVAVPLIAADGRPVDIAVISLADQPIAFGELNSEVKQYFEAYRVTDQGCTPEGF